MLPQSVQTCQIHKAPSTHICALKNCQNRILCKQCFASVHSQTHKTSIYPIEGFLKMQNRPKDELLKFSERLWEDLQKNQETLKMCVIKTVSMLEDNFRDYEELFLSISKGNLEIIKSKINNTLFQNECAMLGGNLKAVTEKIKVMKIPETWCENSGEMNVEDLDRMILNNSDLNNINDEMSRLTIKVKERMNTGRFYKIYAASQELDRKMVAVFKEFTGNFFEQFDVFLAQFNAENKFNEKIGQKMKELSEWHFKAAEEDKLELRVAAEQFVLSVNLFESIQFARRASILSAVEFKWPENVAKMHAKFGVFKFEDRKRGKNEKDLVDKESVNLSDGSIYLGQWDPESGLQSGKGISIFKNGDFYEGWWGKGKPEMAGRFIRQSGFLYEGEIKTGKENGKGVLLGPDGYQYVGYFHEGFMEGMGKETLLKGGGVYQGEFFKNRKHGKGVLEFGNGSVFAGSFFEGKLSEAGVFKWPNGEKYEGAFCKGKKHGKGVYTYGDGRVYEGDFCEDYPHGFGKIQDKEGCIFECFWNHGNPVGVTLNIEDQQRMSFYWKDSVIQNS